MMETFLIVRNENVYWHRVSREQECCSTSYNAQAQDSPHDRIIWPSVSAMLRFRAPAVDYVV